jgi:parallel beta-helix repeat protein
MKYKMSVVLLALFIACLSFGGCKSEKTSINPLALLGLMGGGSQPSYDYYVNVTTGSDTNDGMTPATAFKTITHAVVTAGTDKTIKVAPGMYTLGNGETFPITMQAGQSLIGDIAHKGKGSTTTEIKCTNNTAAGINSADSCLNTANNTIIRGFIFGNTHFQSFVFGVYSGTGLTVNVSDNTFDGNLYGGVYFHSDNLTSENNDFYVFGYSHYLDDLSSSTALINHNIVREFTIIPVVISGGNSNTIISNNTITGTGQSGINVQSGEPIIRNNVFNSATYSYAAIVCDAGSPTIRSNTFTCDQAILINANTADPDIGTNTDHGNNIFTAVTGYAIRVDDASGMDIYAIGNTWPGHHNPPTATDIVINVTGLNVWYGTGVTDHITGL